MKAGTKIRTKSICGVPSETGVILRWHTPTNGPRSSVPGYEKVRFDADGGVVLVHESRMEAA